MKQLVKRLIIKSFGYHLPLSLAGSNYQFPYTVHSCKEKLVMLTKVFCNINFDDQSPVYKQIAGRDYGGNVNEGITNNPWLFLKQYPEIAITSFVIPNFKGNTKKFKDKFLLTKPEYSEWISYYTDLAKKYNLEYAMHGYFHLQNENPFFQSNTEFAFKNNDQAMNYMSKGVNVFNDIGWPITGFRQPGWDFSTSINLPEIAKKLGIKYIAANSYDAGFNAGGIERVSNYYPTIIDGVINFPQNIELDWPIGRVFQQIDFLVEIKALISIKAHFVDKEIINCLSKENFDKLGIIINYIRQKFSKKYNL